MTSDRGERSAIRFLYTDGDGTQFRPTHCWIRAEPGRLTDWSLHLTRPDGESVAVPDLKRWMLFGDSAHRHFSFRSAISPTDMRQYKREEVLDRYARAVVASLPQDYRGAPLWCLIPGIGDPDRRRRYRNALNSRCPG
ncbi:MAG: hypothetical protein IPL61_25730 [Myxococcales bacterium]|nr:hypothetical protein [Myxococcales bacterium]